MKRMRGRLQEPEEVAARLARGETLLLAGDEAALRRLPPGRWIAGTIPYFMTQMGGVVDRRRVFVEALGDCFEYAGVRRYGEEDISRVYADLPAGGVGAVIAPHASAVHLSFAIDAPRYPRFATAPLFGWISGVHLSEIGAAVPLVFDGSAGEALADRAVVMHLRLAEGVRVELGMLNIFEKGSGPALTFPATGFSSTTVLVDGKERALAAYVRESGLDTRLPLVADYLGARINVSFQSIDERTGAVRFFAPVFSGVPYHHARPVGDYVDAFVSALPTGLADRIAFSCNCVLNYVHSSLGGRRTGEIVGPATFGEIAYQLLNQTMVYLTVFDGRRATSAR
jgi:hypothetical protein